MMERRVQLSSARQMDFTLSFSWCHGLIPVMLGRPHLVFVDIGLWTALE